MKKFLILIPIFLLLLWAGITWIIGSRTQSAFTLLLEEGNNKFGAATVVEESYSRGFLSSEAITKFGLTGEADTEENDVFLKVQVWHGPLMMTPDGLKIGAEYVLVTLAKDRLPEISRKMVDQGFKQAEPFELTLFSGFTGEISIDLKVAEFASPEGEVHLLNFKGLAADLKTDSNGSFAIGEFKLGALNYEDKKTGNSFSLAASQGNINFTNIIMQLTGDGSSHADFPEIKVINNGETYTLSDLHFDGSSQQNDGKMEMLSHMSIGNFTGPDKGPYAEIFAKMNGKLEVEAEFKGMDIEALKAMNEAQQKVSKVKFAGEGTDIAAAQKAQFEYFGAIAELLQPGYQMNYLIAFANKNGESEINLNLEYAGENKALDLVTIHELIDSLKIDLKLQILKDLIPPALIEKIKPATAMGFIIEKDSAFEGAATLINGELSVNGKAQPVLKNLGPMLNMPIPWENFGIKKPK